MMMMSPGCLTLRLVVPNGTPRPLFQAWPPGVILVFDFMLFTSCIPYLLRFSGSLLPENDFILLNLNFKLMNSNNNKTFISYVMKY